MAMNSARRTIAPATPHSRAVCWRFWLMRNPSKENEEDEEIVDAERGLDGVAGHEFERVVTALPDSDPDREDSRRSNQNAGPDPCGRLRARLLAAVCRQERIHQQQREHCAVKSQPPPPGSAGNHSVNATCTEPLSVDRDSE